MSNFIRKFLFENKDTSIYRSVLSFLGVIVVRTFLENFSSPYYSGYFFPAKEAYLHFPIYYIAVFLAFALVLCFFTKKPIQEIVSFEAKISLLILLPPIIDLITTNGKGELMSYVITAPHNFIFLFFKLLDPRGFAGITMGIHVAAYGIFFLLAYFVYEYTKNIKKALLSIFINYSILFLYAISPSIVAIPELINSQTSSASDAYSNIINQSWLVRPQENFHISMSQLSNIDSTQYLFDTPLTQLFFIIALLELSVLFIVYCPKHWESFKKNSRLDRIIFWFLIAFTGFFVKKNTFSVEQLLNTINLISLGVFLIIIMFSIWLAVYVNDLEDIEIDRISNPDRPLIAKTFTLEQWKKFQIILLVVIIFGLAMMNSTVAFMFVLAQAAYYIYSVKPLRLKRHYIFSSVIIGLVAVAISMAGFYLISPIQDISAYPIRMAWMIGIAVAIISNFKDIKDYDGDKKEGIRTMPVVFGLSLSKKIIAYLFAIIFLVIPTILNIQFFIFFASCMACFMYYVLNKNKYEEKYVSVLIFIYLITLFFYGKN